MVRLINSRGNLIRTLGVYPERRSEHPDDETGGVRQLANYLPGALRLRALGCGRLLADVEQIGQGLISVSQTELARRFEVLRRALRAAGTTREFSTQAFALIREQAKRTLGKRHYDCQVVAGWVMLNGMVVQYRC